ncbi:MAG: ferredoxin [Silanimonas sp.]|nr:MAG: ferredoxin [Silanimonas sp.]
MALRILETCINCDVCAPACPNGAISQGELIYEIAPSKCTECVGHFDEPQCTVVCPVECIESDPAHPESPEMLQRKFEALQREMANV